MDIKTKEIYSEVHEIIIQLGKNFIDKLPSELYELIVMEKLDTYTPKFDINISLQKQGAKEETIDMIALLYLNYWCESEEEKQRLRQIFNQNEEKYQKEISEKYDIQKIFEKRKNSIKQEVENNQSQSLILHKKDKFLKRILLKIKEFIKNRRK